MADYRGGNRIRYFLKVQGSLVLFTGGARKTGILLYFQGGCTGTSTRSVVCLDLPYTRRLYGSTGTLVRESRLPVDYEGARPSGRTPTGTDCNISRAYE
jgi:hypothetical protein